MLCVIAATEIELDGLRSGGYLERSDVLHLVSGVGITETAVRTVRFLERHHRQITTVVNIGIGGAYLADTGPRAEILDICLAESEALGDYGVCVNEEILPFSNPHLAESAVFVLDSRLAGRAAKALETRGFPCHCGPFVTVQGASGSARRGRLLQQRFEAICENMEGAAVARACREFALPLLEVRTVSNFVEDRPGTPWKIEEACERTAAAATVLLESCEEVF